jgi:hypothetical protein
VVCGAESTTADAEAARFLRGVDAEAPDKDAVAAEVLSAMDALLADEHPGDAAMRADFVRRRYAWSAAADRYAEIICGLMGRQAAIAVLEPA